MGTTSFRSFLNHADVPPGYFKHQYCAQRFVQAAFPDNARWRAICPE
jgi:hypothetical protein